GLSGGDGGGQLRHGPRSGAALLPPRPQRPRHRRVRRAGRALRAGAARGRRAGGARGAAHGRPGGARRRIGRARHPGGAGRHRCRRGRPRLRRGGGRVRRPLRRGGQQRRHRGDAPGLAADRRGLGQRAGREPSRLLPGGAGRGATAGRRGEAGQRRQHRLRGRAAGAVGCRRLHRLQGGAVADDAAARGGVGAAQHPGERDRAGLRPHADQRRVLRHRGGAGARETLAAAPPRPTRGPDRAAAPPRLRRRRAHDRRDLGGGRRPFREPAL
ncbi:MAG: 3-oxoacyl-[acyl-carrier protein] reductase, partial [uncultured Acetobacteraceae bacterium]